MLQLYDDHIDQDESITNEVFPINLPTLPNLKSESVGDFIYFVNRLFDKFSHVTYFY